jgi:cytochrome P450
MNAMPQNWVSDWPSNTWRYYQDLEKSGGIQFLKERMTLPTKDGYHPYLWIPLLHRVNILVFCQSQFWPQVFGFQKGCQVRGGVELDTLASMALSSHTPLTCDDPLEHKKLKDICIQRNFGPKMVEHCCPEVFLRAHTLFHHYCSSTAQINMTDVITQYVSRVTTLALLAPPGSDAFQTIVPLLFDSDGKPNKNWDEIPRAVERIGRGVNEAIMYHPNFYSDLMNAIVDDLVGQTSKTPLQDSLEILNNAVQQVIDKSWEASLNPSGKKITGQIEGMLASGEFSLLQIDAMARLVLVIGQRTTSVALEACIRHLLLYPEWQERIYKESSTVLGKEPDLYRAINHMVDLDNFIWETLRLYPPVPFQARETIEEIDFEGGKIPKGTTVIMAHYLIQRNPLFYSEPEKFNPDRFLDEVKCSKFAMQTFGKAPHQCAGRMLAHTLTIRAAILQLVRSFHLTCDTVTDLRDAHEVGGFILRFDRPLFAKCTRRVFDPQ